MMDFQQSRKERRKTLLRDVSRLWPFGLMLLFILVVVGPDKFFLTILGLGLMAIPVCIFVALCMLFWIWLDRRRGQQGMNHLKNFGEKHGKQ